MRLGEGVGGVVTKQNIHTRPYLHLALFGHSHLLQGPPDHFINFNSLVSGIMFITQTLLAFLSALLSLLLNLSLTSKKLVSIRSNNE